jgi:23S rRNA pseudouridine1911/1915/1917 synthase
MSTRSEEPADYSEKGMDSGISEHIVPVDCAGLRLDQALARMFPDYSRSRLQEWLKQGALQVEGRARSAKDRIAGGERVTLLAQPDPEITAFQPESIALDVLYEDESLLVINKPAGLVVHPGSGNWSGTLLNALLAHAPSVHDLPRAGIVHRLDKDTSGLLVVAKTLAAQTSLVRQLQARTVGREYIALACGRLTASGTVTAPIGRHPTQRTKMAVVSSGRPAVTHYQPLELASAWSLIGCRLETGRTHQIRVHLASIEHPIVGDPVYLSRSHAAKLPAPAREFPRQALHAARLSLIHPRSGAAVTWQVPLAQDIQNLLDRLHDEH